MKKKNEPALREYGIEADKHWQHEVMKLAEKYGFIVQAGGGVTMLMTHQNQLEHYGEAEYLRIQQMNGHCPKTFGYDGCLNKDGTPKECGSCWAAQKAESASAEEGWA